MKNTRWRHWKEGRIYLVHGVALHSETREELVVYQRAGDEAGQLWARPLAEWHEEARPGVPRFVPFVEGEPAPPPRCYVCGVTATTRAWVKDRMTGQRKKVQHVCTSCAGPSETTAALGQSEVTDG